METFFTRINTWESLHDFIKLFEFYGDVCNIVNRGVKLFYEFKNLRWFLIFVTQFFYRKLGKIFSVYCFHPKSSFLGKFVVQMNLAFCQLSHHVSWPWHLKWLKSLWHICHTSFPRNLCKIWQTFHPKISFFPHRNYHFLFAKR